jgi:hypothetical protein
MKYDIRQGGIEPALQPALQPPLHMLLADKNDSRLSLASAHSLLIPPKSDKASRRAPSLVVELEKFYGENARYWAFGCWALRVLSVSISCSAVLPVSCPLRHHFVSAVVSH